MCLHQCVPIVHVHVFTSWTRQNWICDNPEVKCCEQRSKKLLRSILLVCKAYTTPPIFMDGDGTKSSLVCRRDRLMTEQLDMFSLVHV